MEDLLQLLASCRPDVLPPSTRAGLLQNARDLLVGDPDAWPVVVQQLLEIECSSKLAYRRVGRLCCFAIQRALDNEDQHLSTLVQALVRLVNLSMDPRLVNGCPRSPKLHFETDSLGGIALSFHNSPLDYSAPLLDYIVAHWPTEALVLIEDVCRVSESLNESMFPALLLKVKAHPDKALASLGSLLPMVASKATMTDEWASVLVKHLMGTDEARAQLAQSVLVRWLPHQPIGLRALADAKPPLAPARVRLYQVLEPVASEIKEDSIDAVVLDAIIGWLTKDTKKQAGWQALVVWLRRGSLHAPALEAIRKAVQSTEGGEMLELLVRNPLDASTLAALFENDAFGQSLEKFVSNQSKKKSNYDGLLAICVQLLHAHNNEVKVAPWTARVTESSFYSFPVNDIVCSTYPRLVALYCQLQGSSWLDKTFVLDCICSCIMFPYGEDCAVKSLLENLSSVVESRPTVADSLIRRLLQNVNEEALSVKEQARKRQKLEAGTDGPLTRCKEYSIRMAARLLAPHATASDVFTVAAVLMHYGTTVSSGVRHRKKLCDALLWVVRQQLSSSSQLQFSVDIVADLACSTSVSYQDGSEHPSSEGVRGATLSLITSMGRASSTISEGFEDLSDVDSRPHQLLGDFLVTSLSTKLVVILETVLKQIETVSEDDIALYRSPRGTLVASSNADRAEKPKNRSLNEDEAWEREIKEQLSRKKGSVGSVVTLSAQQKKELEEQDDRRDTVSLVVESAYPRVLASLSALVSSDIEVGNRCIPFLYSAMLRAAVMRCPVTESVHSVRQRSVSALVDLAGCVYEISEAHAPAIAESLLLCTTFSSRETDGLDIATLPSPCAPVATVVAQIENVGDTLSSNSFLLLLPILRSCLMGPRSIVGCDSVLKVIEQHIPLLSDPESSVGANERKALVGALLELLSHDRSQTFRSPSPIDILVALFSVDEDVVCLGPSDISPLLDSRGALGPLSCRKASMVALRAVVVSCRKVLRSNPLVESRVWICCFAEDDELRQEGRTTWFLMHDIEDAEEGQELPSPSPLFGPLLVPLLSNQDDAIAKAAAFAFANALGRHPGSSEKSIENLCKTYISACPVLDDGTSGSDATEDIAPRLPPPKKPALATGLPKKKKVSGKVSALSVMSKPKATKKKANTAVMAAMLKPKQERSLGADDLASQFVGKKKTVALEEDSKDKVDVRLGVLRALQALCSPGTYAMQPATLQKVTAFLVAFGIADADSAVKALSTDTLRDSIAVHGSSEEAIAFLLPFLEEVLKSGSVDLSTLENLSIDKVPGGVAPMDRRKEGAVVALGSVALHLKGPDNEAKIDASVEMLLSALGTPSEDVQSSVADALSKLMKKGRTPQRAEEILASLLQGCLRGATLASRRGSAYGLAAAVKGTGIAALKKFDIVKSLEEACSSGDAVEKEGSLFAIELLSKRLGLLFEPYVIVLLPSLLRCFADSSDHVRSAASATSEVIMAKLSAHGVKLVLPAVLTSFNDSAWRTKQASIKLLGAMSHLAPKQLASALPKVVPKLIEAFGDTQQKVKASAQDALDEISTVIKNPEVSSISALLLKALTDPAENTVKALEGLIATEFLHAIDAPSLALIVPIVHRGLRERGASTKRYSGLIAGNICTMINDPRDFVPYLPILLPDLQTALVDPIPDVRSTSAKALGSLTRSLGDQILPELRPWLIRKLRDESCSSAERSGAAQGLTEVLIASGTSSIDETMTTEILPLGMYPEAATREGVLWMMCFLPSAMGQAYTGLIDPSLPVLLSGLSDDSESVRDVAMRAGRTLIRSHGKVHVDKILPSLEVGLANGDHRIRVASLSLLGDLLSTIGGTQMMKGDGNTQDDIRRAERAQAQIALVLGTETRKRVLSRLYLARSDTMHAVRSGAIQVWKTVVSVTARTLRDVLPVLVAQVVTGLASGSEDTTEMAGRCLGDIVSKLGDSVLPQVVPVLRKTLDDGDQHSKRGVCVGLTEVLKASTKDQIVKYLDIIVRVVQDAISDEDVDVRRMAAASFQSLYGVVGSVALDEIVPSLMVSMENTTDAVTRERAMNGLAGILSVRSRELLPYIIPRLIQTPLTLDHVVALSRVASVTGESLYHHFRSIIPILIDEMSRVRGTDLSEKESALDECVRSICKSADSTGVYIFIGEVASKCGSDKAFVRRESCTMLNVIVTERGSEAVLHEHVPTILRELLYRLNDDDSSVLKATNIALASLSKVIAAEVLVEHIEFIRNLIASMVSDARRRKGGVGDGEFLLPGFNMAKGLDPLLPIYQRGILHGTSSIREVSATGLGELLLITSSKYLAGPLMIKMTGPLLRIVGDRNPSSVKIAILKTLGLILVKGGPALRAFVPQFQTTFVKALSDPSRLVRVEATQALALLMPLSTRVDPLIKELVSNAGTKVPSVEDPSAAAAIQTATLQALAVVLEKGGPKAKLPASVSSALDVALSLLSASNEGIREAASQVAGASCNLLPPDEVRTWVEHALLTGRKDPESQHGRVCAVRRILQAPIGGQLSDLVPAMKEVVVQAFDDQQPEHVRIAACMALGPVLARDADPATSRKDSEPMIMKLLGLSKQTALDLHRAIAKGLCIALSLIEDRQAFMGLSLTDACLNMALTSSQRVQFAFNDVLWLLLRVDEGNDGLEAYADIAQFEQVRSMRTLHSKVLSRIKECESLKD